VNFELFFPQDCNSPNDFDEGVEFAFRLDSETTWVPIVYIAPSTLPTAAAIKIGDPNNLVLRGYAVESRISPVGSSLSYSVQLCGFSNQSESIQFRWLQTSLVNLDNTLKDIVVLDDVQISHEPEDGVRVALMEDSFDGEGLKLVQCTLSSSHALKLCSPLISLSLC